MRTPSLKEQNRWLAAMVARRAFDIRGKQGEGTIVTLHFPNALAHDVRRR